MFDVGKLTMETAKISRELGFSFNRRQCKRIVLKIVRRMEREDDRIFGLNLETSDRYKHISYSDPTGETAVMNLIRKELSGT